jgi:hypothetical protein
MLSVSSSARRTVALALTLSLALPACSLLRKEDKSAAKAPPPPPPAPEFPAPEATHQFVINNDGEDVVGFVQKTLPAWSSRWQVRCRPASSCPPRYARAWWST